jgi:hypothetical protein
MELPWSPLNQPVNPPDENTQLNYILQNGNPGTPVPFTVGSPDGYSAWLLAFGNPQDGSGSSTQGVYALPVAYLGGSNQSSNWLRE